MTWTEWETLGGSLAGAPAAASWAPGRLDVFARGTDGALRHAWFGDAWSRWQNLGGALTSSPAAVSWGAGRIDVFARGGDGALWHIWYQNGWSRWQSLGGSLASAPAACSWGQRRLDVFALWADGTCRHRWYDGTWRGWQNLGGTLRQGLGATSWGPGRIDVVGLGTDGAVRHKRYERSWGDWASLGGDVTSAPAVSSSGPGRLDVFGTGGDGKVRHTRNDGRWRAWETVGGALADAPAAVSWGPQRIDLFGVGTDAAVRHATWRADPPATYVRREAWALQSSTPFDPITLAYAKAVKVMQARPATDPTSWTYQAAIHGTTAPVPRGAVWNQCQHRNWFFLPWHRMYLYFFERIVRRAVVEGGGPMDFALPYWNYDRPFPGNTLPPAFRTRTLPDGTSNPLFLAAPRRDATLMRGGRVPATAATSTAAMARTNFSAPVGLPSFGGGRVGPVHFGNALGELESTPHNILHPTIGGSDFRDGCAGAMMTDPDCAALDPVFWLHHANVDRLWNRWLALGGGRANPTERAWLTQSFPFFDEDGRQVTLTGAAVVDSAAQLGYVYDDAAALTPTPAERVPTVAAAARGPEEPPELVAASERPVDLRGRAASVPMASSARSRSRVESAPREGQVLVSVEDVEAERDPGLAYAVYLEVPGRPGARQHLGNVSFFGIGTMNDPDQAHEGEAGFGHTFDATDAVRALAEAGGWDPSTVRVSFEPIRVLPPPGEQEDEAEAVRRAEVETPPVRIGRVSLFVT